MDAKTFSKMKAVILSETNSQQRTELCALLQCKDQAVRTFTRDEVTTILDMVMMFQAEHHWAITNGLAAAAGLVAACLSTNGKDTRRIIVDLSKELKIQLRQLKYAEADALSLKEYELKFEHEIPDGLLQLWEALRKAAKTYIDARGSDAAKEALQQSTSTYNSALSRYSTPLTRRGKRNPNSPASILRSRIDSKMYDRYVHDAGYEQTAIDVAAEFRNARDLDAAKYIDNRKNKRQFARDAIRREKKRRQKLVCVE